MDLHALPVRIGMVNTRARLDQIDHLLAMIRRCERLIALSTDAVSRSPELMRAVAELRIVVARDPHHGERERALAVTTVDGIAVGLAGLRAAVAAEHRRVLATRAA